MILAGPDQGGQQGGTGAGTGSPGRAEPRVPQQPLDLEEADRADDGVPQDS